MHRVLLYNRSLVHKRPFLCLGTGCVDTASERSTWFALLKMVPFRAQAVSPASLEGEAPLRKSQLHEAAVSLF